MKMNITKAGVVTIILLTAVFLLEADVYSQEPTPSPTPAREPATDATKSSGENATKSAPASPAPKPETDFWTQEYMTGDWGGARSKWKEEGVELEFKQTNFVQGVASGGISEGSVYNGKFEMTWKFDLAKVAGWKWWSSEIKSEVRFGGPLLGGTGTISPVNTAAIVPAASGTSPTISAVNFTRIIPKDLKKGDMFAVSFGRYNLLDLVDEDFFAGAGTERFFNIAQIGPLTVLRQVPLITNAASFAYIKGGELRFTIAAMDPNDHSLDSGLDNLLADGVTFAPTVFFPAKYFGKTAKHSFGGAITTKKYTPFDAIKQIIIPGPPINPVQPKRGSWSVNYTFRQFIVERGRKDGWGFFSQVSFADKDTSPITVFFDLGLGGNGLFKSRPGDEFGIAYAYTDLSSVLKDNIDLLTLGNRRLRIEHQLEIFYNFHITPWMRLTGDLQIIRPTRPIASTAIIPGARLEMRF
jgi:porin